MLLHGELVGNSLPTSRPDQSVALVGTVELIPPPYGRLTRRLFDTRRYTQGLLPRWEPTTVAVRRGQALSLYFNPRTRSQPVSRFIRTRFTLNLRRETARGQRSRQTSMRLDCVAEAPVSTGRNKAKVTDKQVVHTTRNILPRAVSLCSCQNRLRRGGGLSHMRRPALAERRVQPPEQVLRQVLEGSRFRGGAASRGDRNQCGRLGGGTRPLGPPLSLARLPPLVRRLRALADEQQRSQQQVAFQRQPRHQRQRRNQLRQTPLVLAHAQQHVRVHHKSSPVARRRRLQPQTDLLYDGLRLLVAADELEKHPQNRQVARDRLPPAVPRQRRRHLGEAVVDGVGVLAVHLVEERARAVRHLGVLVQREEHHRVHEPAARLHHVVHHQVREHQHRRLAHAVVPVEQYGAHLVVPRLQQVGVAAQKVAVADEERRAKGGARGFLQIVVPALGACHGARIRPRRQPLVQQQRHNHLQHRARLLLALPGVEKRAAEPLRHRRELAQRDGRARLQHRDLALHPV
ncbi:AP-1 complex subunit gamma-1 [Babesia caballi]|uniref:AP-1 complex subunit gamma-1 n=1 Tax=Babesia caballi TaxID=5871 RepID=A0AAV4LYE9_BABCB|nr:AP-1 complex subunit gamma-1 [Babesia caballi]